MRRKRGEKEAGWSSGNEREEREREATQINVEIRKWRMEKTGVPARMGS